MNMQGLLKYHHEQVNMSVEECLTQNDGDRLMVMTEYAYKMSESGKEIVLSAVKEEDFVKIIDVIENMVLASIMTNGKGKGLLLEKMQGSLQGFSHTMILTILGILADEEVI